MDTFCTTCGEPWDNYHLRHDAIYDAEGYDPAFLKLFNGKLDDVAPVADQPKLYTTIVFCQNSDADEPLKILEDQGVEAVLEYLKQWDNGDTNPDEREEPWGSSDSIETFGEYVVTYNTRLGYIGLCKEVPQEGEPKEQKKWRDYLKEAGYEFGSSLFILKHCPCCKPEDKLDEEKLAAKEEVARLLGGDTDGLQAELEDFGA